MHTRGHRDDCREQGLAEWSHQHSGPGSVERGKATRPPGMVLPTAKGAETCAPLSLLQAGACHAQVCLSSAAVVFLRPSLIPSASIRQQ